MGYHSSEESEREGLEVGVFTYLSPLVELHDKIRKGVLRLIQSGDLHCLSRVGILQVTLLPKINQLLQAEPRLHDKFYENVINRFS